MLGDVRDQSSKFRGVAMRVISILRRGVVILALGASATTAFADEHLKIAIGAPGNWDSGVTEVGRRAGIFQKHGLDLETLFTNGGGETMQAVISGGVDIGISAGTAATMAAYVKGAPVRILIAGTTGAGDLFWYVTPNSAIKSFADTSGKTVAFSTNGASTHTTALALVNQFKVTPKLIATGASAITMTQALTGQIDVGWASPPFGLDAIRDGKIRVIARGSDAPSTSDQTVRVHIVNAIALERRRETILRFVDAYRESLDYLYTTPEGLKTYADYAQIDVDLARRIRDEFMPRKAMSPDEVSGIDGITKDAIAFKVLQSPLTADQRVDLIRIPPKR
jgi:NitT/TauT family transport system substrate-binding protein